MRTFAIILSIFLFFTTMAVAQWANITVTNSDGVAVATGPNATATTTNFFAPKEEEKEVEVAAKEEKKEEKQPTEKPAEETKPAGKVTEELKRAREVVEDAERFKQNAQRLFWGTVIALLLAAAGFGYWYYFRKLGKKLPSVKALWRKLRKKKVPTTKPAPTTTQPTATTTPTSRGWTQWGKGEKK